MSGLVGYNPDDPVQQGFLAALALGETGQISGNQYTGYGGTNLSNAPTDQYGFPISGASSSAAGPFQFLKGTWDSLASKYNLNFGNQSDQNQGAWLLAQQTYQQKTGGSLEDALAQGNYSSVQKALASIWPSVIGNGANPQGLAASLPSYINAAPGASTSNAVAANGNTPRVNSFLDKTLGSAGSWIGDQFSRVGLIILGVVVIGAALWALLAQQGVVPTPREIVKAL